MYRFIVENNEWLTPTTMLLTLRYSPNETKILSYHSGQYAAIAFSRHGRVSHTRCFSIASSPSELDMLQFGIRVNGRFTKALNDVKPGDDLFVRGPYGGFVFDTDVHQEAVFAAGGIGITPFMSMLRYLRATQYPHNLHLLYGVQSQDNIPFLEELRSIETTMPNLHVIYGVNHGDIDKLAGLNVVRGRVDGAMLHEALEGRPAEKSVFICGPPPFMNNLSTAARIRGVPSDSIITEAFKQGSHRQTGKVVSWPRNTYILGGLGIAVGGFVITVTDIVKNLPTTTLTNSSSAQRQLLSTSSRANDLDTLVNHFPDETDASKTASPATAQAINDAKAATQTTASSSQATSSGTTARTTSNATSASTTKTSTPTPAPAPAPAPKCTTTQSGVTTCV